MAALSNYLENALLNHAFRGHTGGTSYTQPSAIWVGLFTTSPGDDGAGISSEVGGGGYERKQVVFEAPSGGEAVSAHDLTYENIIENDPISHVGLFDAQTGGNLLMHFALNSPRTIGTGDDVIIRGGDMIVEFD